ncbi:hypothetical protein [Dongia deserti]|uniref:hypothetical protein n=1 Tax=Dongia deserti TaxID=2268030 RepID=UPI0013C4B9AD|nr:hypothetical protein [Dongia deserti]
MKSFPRTTDLPDTFNINIGKIVVAHASLEQRLRDIVYEVAGIDHKRGRVLRIARRLADYPELVRDLLRAQDKDIKLSKPKGAPTSFKEMLETADDERNQLVHGVWVKKPDQRYPVLQVVDKTWTQADGKKVNAKIAPHGVIMGDEHLPTVLKFYDVCFAVVEDFHVKVRAILTS